MVRRTNTQNEVTTENFGDLLIESLREAVDIHEGRGTPAVVRSYPVTEREAEVEPAPMLSPAEIRELRTSLKLSQPVFARALNVSPATNRAWEQAQRVPDGPSLRLLQIVRRHPGVLLEYVSKRTAQARPTAQARQQSHATATRRAKALKRGK